MCGVCVHMGGKDCEGSGEGKNWHWWVSQLPGYMAANTVNWTGEQRINKGRGKR